jgi:hypothetical protein
MYHEKRPVYKDREKLLHKYQKEEQELAGSKGRRYWRSIDGGEYVELEHPYQEGYYFSLELDFSKTRSLPEDTENTLKELAEHFVSDYMSMDKRPAWRKFYNPQEDEFEIPAPKDANTKTYKIHLFAWYEMYQNTDGSFRKPYYFNRSQEEKDLWAKMLPFMEMVSIETYDWRNERHTQWYYTLAPKWRKYFKNRRWNRMITHKYVIDGAKVSQEDFLSYKVWEENGTGLRKYSTNYHRYWDEGWSDGKKIMTERVSKKDFRDQIDEAI